MVVGLEFAGVRFKWVKYVWFYVCILVVSELSCELYAGKCGIKLFIVFRF